MSVSLLSALIVGKAARRAKVYGVVNISRSLVQDQAGRKLGALPQQKIALGSHLFC
jgi:hypothetical protein